MPADFEPRILHIGLVAEEPIRVAGLASIFEQPGNEGKAQLATVAGSAAELLAGHVLEYIAVDLHSANGLQSLDAIHRARPHIRLIAIGPAGDDELVMNAITAGARAYLDPNAGAEVVRQAVDAVNAGSIWASRLLLSKLIDRLLRVADGAAASSPELTLRERQVMELILLARSNREIAKQLGIEERTVKAYVGRLMRKTGADNRIKLSMSPLGQSLLPVGVNGRSAQ